MSPLESVVDTASELFAVWAPDRSLNCLFYEAICYTAPKLFRQRVFDTAFEQFASHKLVILFWTVL
jgi:hypothetical protein